ncbi:MAG: polysaccharide deacetylase family protein [Deltaproteobacteria bacterium]|nr:polysaccharide deacetylase family protein [Deltaproteobacteria bacterium]
MSELRAPYDYSPIIRRKPIRWPNNARIAVWVIPNIEHFRLDLPSPAAIVPGAAQAVPDVINYAWRDYGVRVGVWRMIEVMARHHVRGTVALNSDVCREYPVIIEECQKLGWEFMAHGTTNSIFMNRLKPEEQRAAIRESIEVITKSTGQRPEGWLGPGLAETPETLDLLAEAGVRYVGDWVNDDQPYPMRVKTGSMLSMPYPIELNDVVGLIMAYQMPRDFEELCREQFDVLYEEGATNGRVMGIAIHPYIIGTPNRIRCLDHVLAYLARHEGVWFATGQEIADWYRTHYL